ncbi:MAG: type II toxin-antitoxin system VapC family toxin [Deltaproteobacteria bacterium]|nr:type II toxin-antitoxin system VapC family toxin [Deltaproteobacteria bacterium]
MVVRQPPFSDSCRGAFRQDVSRAIAFLARIECRSAIERLARQGTLNASARRRSLTKIDKLVAAFDIVAFSPEVEAHALALLGRHSLRSLDALHLGCARRLAPQGDTDALPEFVCCDRRLAEAAVAEGFALVIGP